MQLSEANQAVLKQFVEQNTSIRQELKKRAEAKNFLFALNSSYAHLCDLFNHLDKLANLDRADSKFETKAFELARKAYSSAYYAQYFRFSPLHYYNDDALVPHKDSFFDQAKLSEQITNGFISNLGQKHLVPGMSNDEKYNMSKLSFAFEKIFTNDFFAERKPQGYSTGSSVDIKDTNGNTLLKIGYSPFVFSARGPMKDFIPEHLLHEMEYYFCSNFTNEVDLRIANTENSSKIIFPQHGKIVFNFDQNDDQAFRFVEFKGDRVMQNYFDANPDEAKALKTSQLTLFKRFFETKLLPYFQKQGHEVGFVQGGFSFEGSQAQRALRN